MWEEEVRGRLVPRKLIKYTPKSMDICFKAPLALALASRTSRLPLLPLPPPTSHSALAPLLLTCGVQFAWPFAEDINPMRRVELSNRYVPVWARAVGLALTKGLSSSIYSSSTLEQIPSKITPCK